MKLCWILGLMLLLLSCKDDIGGGPSYSGKDEYASSWTEVMAIDSSCLEIAAKVKVTSNFDPSRNEGFTNRTTFWTFNLPDSLMAVGQPIQINFTPVEWEAWKECGNKYFPDQIEINRAGPITKFSYFEVLGLSSECNNMVLVNVLPYYLDTPIEQAYCINLPESQKIVGNRFRGWSRSAGIRERIKCVGLKSTSQIKIYNPTPW